MECEFKLPASFERLVHDAVVSQLKGQANSPEYIPDRDELAEALQVALWASVLRDEGRAVAFTINLRPATVLSRLITLKNPVELTAAQLAKLSMATKPRVSAVHVGPGPEGLEIFGVDTVVGKDSAVRIEVIAPATVAVKAADATVAFISGRNAEIIDLEIYAEYFFIDPSHPVDEGENADRERRFFDVARAMHRAGHGGTLLILGAASSASSGLSADLETHYLLARAFAGLREVDAEETSIFSAMQAATSGTAARSLFASLRETELLHSQYISGLARTTVIDGATVVSAEGSLLAFGCKVLLQSTPDIRIRLPTVAKASAIALADFGGTRHQSAARFVGRYPGSRAIVASQDGKVSILKHVAAEQVDCLEHAEWCF